MSTIISLVVYGDAQPAGSKKAYTPKGARFPVVVDANPRAAGWKTQIGQACANHYGGVFLDGALEMTMRFYKPRPQGHFRTGKHAGLLKDSAPLRPATAPDADKLARAVLDGLQGQLYRNDAQVVDMHASKHYGEPARVEIEVSVLDRQTVGQEVLDTQLALVA